MKVFEIVSFSRFLGIEMQIGQALTSSAFPEVGGEVLEVRHFCGYVHLFKMRHARRKIKMSLSRKLQFSRTTQTDKRFVVYWSGDKA